jgi:hypothetical protein
MGKSKSWHATVGGQCDLAAELAFHASLALVKAFVSIGRISP